MELLFVTESVQPVNSNKNVLIKIAENLHLIFMYLLHKKSVIFNKTNQEDNKIESILSLVSSFRSLISFCSFGSSLLGYLYLSITSYIRAEPLIIALVDDLSIPLD